MPTSFAGRDRESENRARANPSRFSSLENRSRITDHSQITVKQGFCDDTTDMLRRLRGGVERETELLYTLALQHGVVTLQPV